MTQELRLWSLVLHTTLGVQLLMTLEQHMTLVQLAALLWSLELHKTLGLLWSQGLSMTLVLPQWSQGPRITLALPQWSLGLHMLHILHILLQARLCRRTS